MNTREINRALSIGAIDAKGVLPLAESIKKEPIIFKMQFGLDELPPEPGLIVIRGARQYGKSTWLQQKIAHTVKTFAPGSAYYLNGDELGDESDLIVSIRELLPLFSPEAEVRRLFIDEITAVENWQKGMKRLLDAGELQDVLVVTTGSKAADLRRGSERLPGRKGKLDRTTYLFTPLAYGEFKKQCEERLQERVLPAYILSGGSPVAGRELAIHGRLPEYVVEMTRDWIYGEVAASGRQRSSLLGVMECLYRFGGTPVGQAKLARETGLANNTIAAGYIELLKDLLCVSSAHPWDSGRERTIKRKPCKFHMTNLLAAVAWHPARVRSVDDFLNLPTNDRAYLTEWTVAQEIWRRAAIKGLDLPEELAFWQSKSHELDFVLDRSTFVEVKIGSATPVDFSWFAKSFPQSNLMVVNQNRFTTRNIEGITLENFLLS